MRPVNRHTLSVLVENKPGVLTRVAALFARRAFNIASLAVGETEDPSLSRITIVVDNERVPIEQIKHQLDKLVNVVGIAELDPEGSISRQLVLYKVKLTPQTRQDVIETVRLFRAHVIDVHVDSIVVESIGSKQKVEALLAALEPYGILEISQSGIVAIERGPHSFTDQVKEAHCG